MTIELDYPVIGIRHWQGYPSEYGYLRSLFGHGDGLYEWKPGINEAACMMRAKVHNIGVGPIDPIAPNEQCKCGLYAYHELNERQSRAGRVPRITGIVRGRMLCHPDGWRSQYAEVLALITGIFPRTRTMPRHQPIEDGRFFESSFEIPQICIDDHVRAIAARYRLPTVSAQALPDIALEFGRPVPVAKRPYKIEHEEN
jgi:hypothetical protein